MANRIQVSTEWLTGCAGRLQSVIDAVQLTSGILGRAETTEVAGGSLSLTTEVDLKSIKMGFCSPNVRGAIERLRRLSVLLADHVMTLSSGVMTVTGLFEAAENEISAIINAIEGNTTAHKTVIPSDPFDDVGLYGGNQSSIKDDVLNHAKYREIIENNAGHALTDAEFRIYLKRMASEGCGYIALCNSIFAAYKDDSQGFENTFGFSMYDEDDLNYNQMFADLYSKWDNRSADGTFNEHKDYDTNRDGDIAQYSYWNDDSGSGTNIDWRGDVIEAYLNEYGIKASSEVHSNETLTARMYNRMVENGEVQQGQLHIRMSGEPAHMYDEQGVRYSYSGGHAMTVTGTTGDGDDARLIVSSWGSTYYIDPADFCANDSNGGPSGSMGYMIMRIEGKPTASEVNAQ